MGSICQNKSGLALQEMPEQHSTSTYHSISSKLTITIFSVLCNSQLAYSFFAVVLF